MKTLDDAPFLDIFDRGFNDDPAAFIDPIRHETWVVRTMMGGLVIDHDMVQRLLADKRLVSSVLSVIEMQGVTDGLLHERAASSLLAVDGPDHTRIRRVVSRAFTPRATEPHRAHMQAVIGELVDGVAAAGRCEFVGDIATHYPIRVMCHVLGVPEEDHEDFARWNDATTWLLSFSLSDHRDEAEWGMGCLGEYIERLVADRRARPGDDMVTALVQADDDGDSLDDRELLTLISSLIFAGYDTTRNQLGLAIAIFAEHPDQWAALAADPALAPAAVEEVMRFRGATAVAPRMVGEACEIGGYAFEAGTILTLSTAAANHDPAVHDAPGAFDISVDREPQLTFGGGPHYCLGASLARAEMHEALPVLAGRMPDLALDGEPTWRPPFGIFGPETLPLRFTAT